MKRMPALLLLALALPPGWADTPIDRVVVDKSDRTLSLMSGPRAVRTFPIYLGGQPVGHKRHQGDRRTPEGRYLLHARNRQSRYYRALRISYPNDADRAAAQALGKPPGGDIMVHGMPSLAKRNLLMFEGSNWTDGCIALSNPHMAEVWSLVKVGTPIEIFP